MALDNEMYEMGRALAARVRNQTPQPPEIVVKAQPFDLQMVAEKLDVLNETVGDAKAVCEEIAVLRKAVMALADYMPEMDFTPLAEAISAISISNVHNEVDSRPELARIGAALEKIVAEMKESRAATILVAAALDRQTEALLREKKISYNSSGQIISIK